MNGSDQGATKGAQEKVDAGDAPRLNDSEIGADHADQVVRAGGPVDRKNTLNG